MCDGSDVGEVGVGELWEGSRSRLGLPLCRLGLPLNLT